MRRPLHALGIVSFRRPSEATLVMCGVAAAVMGSLTGALLAAEPEVWRSGWTSMSRPEESITCARELGFNALMFHGSKERMKRLSAQTKAAGIESYYWFSPIVDKHEAMRRVMKEALAIRCFGAGTAQAASNEPEQFRAACVKVDITPDTPQWLQGYGPRQSTGVHDRIYHRIAILDDGTTTLCLVSTDICTISPSFYHDFCERLEQETQIRSKNFWWSTTHTHSAPHVGPQDLAKSFAGTLGDRFSIKHDTVYWASVADKLVRGIKEAQARLEPARLGIVSYTAAANVNRRQRRADGRTVLGVNPEGPADRQLGVFRLERPDATLIGLIANYAIHGTALGGGNKLISGDVPCLASQCVERSTGVPMMFINCAEGNVAPLH
ncbi:MAG: neutral/alkaline non-lysosomal ceramidase N-terminal domain-containing protein, partial [Planctomycetes bacterium]|nr:neutral/alkaline non-lysosomal ceramidase N-terminal domain-containing protein [Planctomycetota bacterium]